LDYCPNIVGMLASNHSCICHSFPTRWSPYSSRRSSTCWEWHFPIPDNTMRCHSPFTPGYPLSGPTFWKPSGLVLYILSCRLFWRIAYTSKSLPRF
jgi:hypothetical protein